MTVLDVRNQQRQAAQTAVTAAQAALGTADSDLVAARATLATATDAMAALQREQATIETSLATAALPADVNQLELDLEHNLLAQQPARAALLDAQEAVAVRTAARLRVAAAVDRAKAALTLADAALAAATADAAAVTAWKATLGSQSLADAKTTAAGQATTDLVTAADAKLATWLGGADLLALVRSRWHDATSRAEELIDTVDRAAAAQDALRKSITATSGDLAEQLAAAGRARDAVRWAAEAALPQLAWALTTLGAVAAGTGAPTAAEQLRIDDRAATATDPAKHEKAVHDALADQRAADAYVSRARMVAIAADPSFDPNDASLQPLIDDANAKDAAVTTAEAAFPPTDQPILAEWEVAVPSAVIALAASVFRAEAIIAKVKALKATGPGSVAEALDDADDAVADAIEADAAVATRLQAAADAVAEATDGVAAVAATADQRLVAAVRGDD